MKKITTESFIEKAKGKWEDKYDYSKVEYVNDCTKVTIICKEHGEFYQSPNTHYRSECLKCGLLKRIEKRKNNVSDLIIKFKEKHGDKYDYSKMFYIKMKERVTIICRKHSIEFLQSPEKHLLSKTGGCPECNSMGKGVLGKDNFIKKSIKKHGDVYDYINVIYIDSKTKVKIICRKHGQFEMVPNSHLSGRGCPICNRNGSILENRWLDELNISPEYRQYKISRYYVDGFDPETKTIYEFYGDFWHGNLSKYNSDDINNVIDDTFGSLYKKTLEREDYLKSLGYKIISIWESDYKKIYKI
jgi:hypothetical protein